MTAAASLGGDSDTTAAMVGAIGGAVYGPFAATAIQTVTEVNHLDLQPLVEGLLELR
jgi:ADP-ribosylglycohydrolase